MGRLNNNDVERIWKEVISASSRYYTNIRLKGLRKTTGNIHQDSQCAGGNSNRRPAEHSSTALPLAHPLQ
jgi:hypothetical protein